MKRQPWRSQVTDEGEEIVIVSAAIADAPGDLDSVVEALRLAGADRKDSMSGEAIFLFVSQL